MSAGWPAVLSHGPLRLRPLQQPHPPMWAALSIIGVIKPVATVNTAMLTQANQSAQTALKLLNVGKQGATGDGLGHERFGQGLAQRLVPHGRRLPK